MLSQHNEYKPVTVVKSREFLEKFACGRGGGNGKGRHGIAACAVVGGGGGGRENVEEASCLFVKRLEAASTLAPSDTEGARPGGYS